MEKEIELMEKMKCAGRMPADAVYNSCGARTDASAEQVACMLLSAGEIRKYDSEFIDEIIRQERRNR